MITRLVVCLAMVLALAGALPGAARADWDDRPDPSEYEESLSPHGYWVDDPSFGRVWRPYMHWGWQPYVDGQWLWTSYGWTWSSPEPWGWTFHYGRWGFSNAFGWVWTPGYVWGPAWVDWYWGDGYVGWVPLAPIGFAVVPSYWTYVNTYSFCAPRISNVVIVHNRLPRHIVHHRDNGWGHRRAPDFRDIEHVSRHRIMRASDRPRDTVAPWVRNRVERGERVRERVADRGQERVIEHGGGRLADADRRDRPRVSEDDWRRARRDDGHRMVDRGVDRGDRGMGHRSLRDPSADDRDGGGRIIEVPRGRVDARRNLDADRNTVRPGPRQDGDGMWTHERSRPMESGRPPMGRGTPVPSVRGGDRGGGGVTMGSPRGSGTPAMQHGGGGATRGGGAPSSGPSHGGGGGSPSGSPGGGQGGGGRSGGGHVMTR